MLPENNRKGILPGFLDDFFNDEFWPTRSSQRGINVPCVNVKENDNEYNIEVAAPGLNKEDFDVSLDGNVLTVSAEKKDEDEEKNKDFTRKEFSYTSFKRSFTCPESVDKENIDASYNDGVLNIKIPKKEEAKDKEKKKIDIS